MDVDRIAILGWGSLLWDEREEFDAWHEPWHFDGPSLKIEFSRVSKSRLGALTLVIDNDHGGYTKVAYCISSRHNIELAVEDLRIREAVGKNGIGHFQRGGVGQFRDNVAFEAIAAWAESKELVGVVWTDLQSNFAKETGKKFSVDSALMYLAGLEGEAKEKAEKYLNAAPKFVETPLRRAWFAQNQIDSNYKPC